MAATARALQLTSPNGLRSGRGRRRPRRPAAPAKPAPHKDTRQPKPRLNGPNRGASQPVTERRMAADGWIQIKGSVEITHPPRARPAAASDHVTVAAPAPVAVPAPVAGDRQRQSGHRPGLQRTAAAMTPASSAPATWRSPLPTLPAELLAKAAVDPRRTPGPGAHVLPYHHYSVVMNGERRLAFFTGGEHRRPTQPEPRRETRPLVLRPAGPQDEQVGERGVRQQRRSTAATSSPARPGVGRDAEAAKERQRRHIPLHQLHARSTSGSTRARGRGPGWRTTCWTTPTTRNAG